MVDYNRDSAGLAAILRSSDMQKMIDSATQGGADHAASIAPVGETGEYAASFGVDSGVEGDRATGRLYNSSEHAAAVEWSIAGSGYHVLSRTADWLES